MAPFLTYLTVFKSRLGTVNIVLDLTSLGFTPAITLERKLRTLLSERVPIDVSAPESSAVLTYLVDKKLVGSAVTRRSGRYQDFVLTNTGSWNASNKAGKILTSVGVFRTDLFLSDPLIASTVGVPTPDNAPEFIELAQQIGVLSRSKCSWTAAGRLVTGLRSRSGSYLRDPSNPFILGLESPALLRQILRVDGLLLRQIVAFLLSRDGRPIKRDEVADALPILAADALRDARALRRPNDQLTEGKKFLDLLTKTGKKRATRGRSSSGSAGPGVFEHRTAPRLEWLTDFGVLTKSGLPSNGFQYLATPDTELFSRLLAESSDPVAASDEIAIAYWRQATHFLVQRELTNSMETIPALFEGYRVMERSLGPVAMREMCFVACLLSSDKSITHSEMTAELIQWAIQTEGASLSGGRYTRAPELVHITESLRAHGG